MEGEDTTLEEVAHSLTCSTDGRYLHVHVLFSMTVMHCTMAPRRELWGEQRVHSVNTTNLLFIDFLGKCDNAARPIATYSRD